MACKQCKGKLNEGKTFCSKECYRLFRSHKGFHIKNAHHFPKGHIFQRRWTDEQRKQIGEYSRLGIVGMKGKKHSKNTKEIMSKKGIGRKHTDITKKKISLIQRDIKKEYWNEMIKNGYEIITPKDKLERRRFRNEIQKQILKRDNYTCQLCHKRGGILHVDHIQSWAEYVELRFCIDNCRTLCMKCHYEITFGKPMPPSVRAWGQNLSKEGMKNF